MNPCIQLGFRWRGIVAFFDFHSFRELGFQYYTFQLFSFLFQKYFWTIQHNISLPVFVSGQARQRRMLDRYLLMDWGLKVLTSLFLLYRLLLPSLMAWMFPSAIICVRSSLFVCHFLYDLRSSINISWILCFHYTWNLLQRLCALDLLLYLRIRPLSLVSMFYRF